ncbi:MAG: AMP-binding protein [Bacillota bacterium]|nr:AMP-binding protein [Bacillota bacterium]
MFNNGWVGNYSYFRARITPDKEAVYDLDNKQHYTYQDLEERANILGNYLKDKLNLSKGDRIATISRNRVELLDLYYATGKTGTIFVPYNARLSEAELIKLINKEKPKVLFFEDIFLESVENIKKETSLEKIISFDDMDEYLNYSEIMDSKNKNFLTYEDLDFEDTHMIIHTGGTTGLPKGAKLSHRAMLFNSMNEVLTWGISHTDSAHILLPLFHTGGWNLLTLPILHAGGRILINKQFDPDESLQTINDEKPTFVFGAATIFRMMINSDKFDGTDFSSVKWVMAGAAPTPINIMEKFWQRDIPFVLGYGMTEAGPNNLTAPAEFMNYDEMREKFASVGKPMYFTQARIVDDSGKEVEDGTPGELIWSGPQIFSGYWDNDEETKKTLRDGWVYTGDMAQKDEDGFYYIVGRKKNMYISGGENVFPPEVEKVIYDFEGVNEVIVIGVKDDKWGEVGKAVISQKKNKKIDTDKLKKYLLDNLAKYKVPKYYKIVEDLPKNNVGKIVRNKVSELYGSSDNN